MYIYNIWVNRNYTNYNSKSANKIDIKKEKKN